MHVNSASKEQKLIVDAINIEDNSEILEELFYDIKKKSESLFNKEFLPRIISHNEDNIKSIIQATRENSFKDITSEELIYNSKFIEVCSTPIFLPETFMGLLSGEFIIYLYREGNLQLKIKETIDCKREEFIEEKEYKQYIKEREYDLLNKRFFKGKSSYAKQLQEAFPIDIHPLLNDNKRKNNIKRSDTKLWKLFETYSYLQNHLKKLSNDNERVNVFRAFSKEYTDIFPLRLDKKLNTNQKNILLLKTFLFQEMDDKKENMCELSLAIKNICVSIRNRINNIRYFLSMLKMASIHKSDDHTIKFEPVLDSYLGFFDNFTDVNIKSLKSFLSNNKDKFSIKIDNQDELYSTLLTIIIIYETLRDMEDGENRFAVDFSGLDEHNKSQVYWNLNYSNQTIPSDWNEFYTMQKNVLKKIVGEKTECEYKKLWLIALNILLHCFPHRVDISFSTEFPRMITEAWLTSNNVKFDKFHMTELYALMCIIDKSENIPVSLEGINSKSYSSLKRKSVNTKSFKSILKNISKHNKSELERLISYLIAEQHDAILSDSRIVACTRNLYKMVRLGVESLIYLSPKPDIVEMLNELIEYHNILAKISNTMYMSVTPEYHMYYAKSLSSNGDK